MASVDELFRRPNAPPKRKLEDPTSSFSHRSNHSNKATKLSNGASAHSSSRTNGGGANPTRHGSKAASVQDETPEEQVGEDDNDDDDIEAGPSLPPEDTEDDPSEDDEEGRFFGGGVSKQERQVLDFIDQNGAGDAEEKIDSAWLKRTAITFERKINKNAELRAKFEDEPLKFVASEADLDTEIKSLSLLSEHGELYLDFVKMGCVNSLVGLLAHENTDIAIAVCELLAEMTDEDSGAEEEQWNILVNAMMEADVVDLLVSNLGRLDEINENDRTGVYHVLNVVENLLSESKAAETFGSSKKMLEWLKKRIETPDPEARANVGQNRQYAAEILGILLQGNEANRQRFANMDGLDVVLRLLSTYRKRDPEKDSDEEEFVENLFDCLVVAVKDDTGANKFLENEGVELCLIMLREGKLSKMRALRVLDHALGGQRAGTVGDRFVDSAGLKTIFGMFMKSKKQDRETNEHIIGIFASLLRYLPADSAPRIRLLAKFVERKYEKIEKLAELKKEYSIRLGAVDSEIEVERQGLSQEDLDDLEAEWLSRRFDAGLFTIQTLDVIMAWLVAEDDGVRQKLEQLLPQSGAVALGPLQDSLREQLDGLDPETGKETKEMLEALLRCLA